MSRTNRPANRTSGETRSTNVQRSLIAVTALVILFDIGIVALAVSALAGGSFDSLLAQVQSLGGLLEFVILRVGLPFAAVLIVGWFLQRKLFPDAYQGAGWYTPARAIMVIGGLVSLPVIGVVFYLMMVTHTLIDVLLNFRDIAVIGYMFMIRIAVPIILMLGIGAFINHKLNPDSGDESHPAIERHPRFKRIHLPHFSGRGIVAITFVAALWAAFIGVIISRFFFGLSYTTNMTDAYPWGLWLVFDMISGVALAAGGFVLCAAVYVFNLEKYHPIVRPAVLTAFLGYLLAIFGLLFDLGRWYQVFNATVFWNLHSPLIEVAWCVMLYSTVLALEFSPIVFERFNLKWPLKIVRRITLPLVIAGIGLSTLHQSTLGTLFVIMPEKINPLWYSGLLPVFFFVSAVATGLCMIIVESNLSARFLGQELESNLLQDLGKAASIVIALYLVIRGADLLNRGALGYAFQPGLHAALFWVEIVLGFVVPMILLSRQAFREHPRLLFAAAGLFCGGIVMNRIDTALLSWWQVVDGSPVYVPTLAEVIGSVSLISIGVVAFGVIAKNFPVFEKTPHHAPAPAE